MSGPRTAPAVTDEDLPDLGPPVAALATTTHEREGVTVVHVSGEVDVATAPDLQERLVALVAEGSTELVVDLTGVAFMDSSGLGVLVAVHRRLRALHGRLRVVVDARVRRLFELTSLDAVLTLHPDLGEALAAAHGR